MVLDEPAVPATKFKRHVREVCELRAWHAVLVSFLFLPRRSQMRKPFK